MSKELEALNKIQHDFGQLKGQELVSCYETIFNALKRLEAIDNSNPSEALKSFETLEKHNEYDNCWQIFSKEIKQALLKAQEPKHYLKWEDLEFKELEFKVEQKKDFKVKLNDTEYGLEICITFGIKEALIFDEKKVLYAVFHERHKQFFNDLHLERVEE